MGMKYICLKHFHWFLPIWPKLYWNKTEFSWIINFDKNCKYNLGDNDQYDWNKIVGISHSINPRNSSVRLVWRYNNETGFIEIGSFIETKKDGFKSELLCSVGFNRDIIVSIILDKNTATVKAGDNMYIGEYKIPYRLGIQTNVYFGGNRTCPHYMSLNLKKLI